MTNINPVGSSASTATLTTLREYAKQSSERTGGVGEPPPSGDRVEISDRANFLSLLAGLPDARARKIVEVRNAIADGLYETPEKLDLATERLLDSFSAGS